MSLLILLLERVREVLGRTIGYSFRKYDNIVYFFSAFREASTFHRCILLFNNNGQISKLGGETAESTKVQALLLQAGLTQV